jgi:acetyl-CoA synthetase
MKELSIRDFWKEQERDIIIHGKKMNVIESCVTRHSIAAPDRIALHFEDENGRIEEINYLNLEKKINKFSNYLKKLGAKKGSRIALFLPKCSEMYVSLLSIINIGAIAIPLFEAFQEDGLELRLRRGEVNFIITNKELEKRIGKEERKMKSLKKIIIIDENKTREEIQKQKENFKMIFVKKTEPCLMIFTSSTAGTPVAGVLLSHYALVQQHYTADLVLQLFPEDRYWCTAHPGWVTGSIYGILAPLSIGTSIFVLEGRFDAKKWTEFLLKNKINVLYTAPTALRLWKDLLGKNEIKNLKVLASVGEALPSSIFERYKSFGLKITDTYWQTETGAMVIAGFEDNAREAGSIGKAIPGLNVKVKNEMMMIEKGWPSQMIGIYKHEKMYKSYFEGKWFRTNDGAFEKDGLFFFQGRKDDIIKTSGERVSPLEIESILLKHPAVKESAVIGVPDELKGEVIKAVIVLKNSKEANEKLKEEIAQFVKKNYAGHAYPKIIEFFSELPKTNSGKIIRMKLREKR